jgi:uncharacterized protein YlxW (UPF0749 family)
MTEPRERPYDTVDRVTMPLLTLVTTQALDEDYAHVAERRAVGVQESRGVTWWTWLAVTVLVGVLMAVAIAQTAQEAVASQSSRTTLIGQIDEERGVLAETQAEVGELEAEIDRLQTEDDRTAAALAELQSEVRRIRARTGYAPVRGEGVRIVVDDSPSGAPAETVRDEDLALLVNGLWSAGAEAIAVNDQRVTALTYIQNSGPAINVNSRPLVAPYTIEGIGDTRTLQANFLESSSGAQFNDLARLLGFVFERHNEALLRLPGAGPRPLRWATTGQPGGEPKPMEEGGAP